MEGLEGLSSDTRTQVWDVDEEPLLRHFCLEAECEQVLEWFMGQGYKRPEDFADRIALAKRLRELSNDRIKQSDIGGGMMLALGSLHCLDFSKGQSAIQSDEQKEEVSEATVPLLSNLRAGQPLRAKLLYRRGLGRCQVKEFEEALKDFVESARLAPEDREIRIALDDCKAAARGQQESLKDRWRGAMTPTKLSVRKKLQRCFRTAKYQTKQALSQGAEGFVTVGIILLAPLCACAFGLLLRFLRRG
ncbi:unnamed protein product [Effrenium voratum]|uniref:Uncharacterized protein n=1 Tax=Effrenium voratum TaxID=2562239 RepID=A0AA36I6K1_9DINO|nr:unnamed protein product [Effrenium voratum]